MEGHWRTRAIGGIHLPGTPEAPDQAPRGDRRLAPAPVRRASHRDQFQRAPRPGPDRALAALFLSAKSNRLYRRQAAVSLISMKAKATRKTTKPARKAPARPAPKAAAKPAEKLI